MRLRMLFFTWLFSAVFLWGSKPVLAQDCGGSTGCQVTSYECQIGWDGDEPVWGTCYADPCDGSCDERSCGPCEYWAGGGCHNYCEGGEEPPGNYRECKGPQNVSCPTAENVDWGSCTKWFERTPTVCSLGNAQYYDDLNCKTDPEGQEVCRTGVVVTCGCCPAGTISAYEYVDGDLYTVTSGPHGGNGGIPQFNCYPGRFVSQTTVNCRTGFNGRCEWTGGPWECCDVVATCKAQPYKVYSCTPTCSPTAPSTPLYHLLSRCSY